VILKNKTSIKYLFAYLLILSTSYLIHFSEFGEKANNLLLDTEIRFTRHFFPKNVDADVVVIGIDETTIKQLSEPFALWHKHLGNFLQAVALGEARVVGLDIVLPDRSFNEILAGYDESLMMGILKAKRVMPVVLALTLDSSGNPRPLYRKFELVAGKGGTGFALFPLDSDNTVRRFDEYLGEDHSLVPTIAGQMARALNITPKYGLIDYSVGGQFNYIPLHVLLDWFQNNNSNALKMALSGKSILLGSVLPAEDRLHLPINLASWENNNNYAPGVLVHAQTLRSILADRIVEPFPVWVVLILIFLVSLIWFFELSAISSSVLLILISIFFFAFSAFQFRQGHYLPVATVMLSLTVAIASRLGYESFLKIKERLILKRSFSGAVSPALMREILAGKFTPKLGGERQYVCILFADIRGFTTLSESTPPEEVVSLLNRYFEGVVSAIHSKDGLVLCFMGDGIMAVFGAPKITENPALLGFNAAQEMLGEVARLNATLTTEGKKNIKIGIGLHCGEVIIGNVGASSRHDYTAIGDVANVASRLEGLTKDVGCQIVFSEEVFGHLSTDSNVFKTEFINLGKHPIKGHTPVLVYGWGKFNESELSNG